MKTVTNKYTNEIWSLYQKNAHSSGMGNYGIGLDAQRNFYRKLHVLEKSKYEEAVLDLCRNDEFQKANVALYLSSELSDVFPADWVNRVIPIVEELVEKGLLPAYKNTTTYAVLNLILSFNIFSLVPFAKIFSKQITTSFKQGVLPLDEWELLYSQTSKILIKLSTEDFWEEFKSFHEDHDLLNLLGSKARNVILPWSSFGAFCYGLEWLSRLVTEYSRIPNITLKAQALFSIEQSSNVVVSMNPSNKNQVKELLCWAKEELNNH